MDNMAPEKPASILNNWKVIVGGIMIVAAVIVLIVTSTRSTAQYFLTVDELLENKALNTGETVRISGAVRKGSIQYNVENLELVFDLVHIPADQDEINKLGGLAQILRDASENQSLSQVTVRYHGVKPDLLTQDAQAIITGSLDESGYFQADELLLKCPSRYDEAVPGQVVQEVSR